MLEGIDYSISEDVGFSVSEDAVNRVVDTVLAEEGIERPCMVSVSFVTDDEMRELNHEWRGIDAVTDVLSLECERPDDPDLAPLEPCALGDIVLAPSFIAAQAERLDTPFETELTLLLVHGTLHLLGYDHLEEAEAKAMESREDELVSRIVGQSTHVRLTRHREGEEA